MIKDNLPYAPSPEEVPEGSKHVYCEEHEMYMVKDAMGNWFCIMCLLEERQ